MLKFCSGLSDCDVARRKNTAFEYEPRGSCLCFPGQTKNIIETRDETGQFIAEALEISRYKLGRMKEFAQNLELRPLLAGSNFDMVNIGIKQMSSTFNMEKNGKY